jgi:DNA-binding FadR family transcriptional regulator
MQIVEAIAAHDPEAAEQAMRRHLSRVAEALRTHDGGADPTAASAGAVHPQPGS